MTTLATALGNRVVVLDGGLATLLESRGTDVSGALWSARLLHDDPEALVRAHAAYLEAGAEVVTTASYQASAQGFASLGLDDRGSAALLTRSVALARRAVAGSGRPAWVAASVGPYGAVLADGSEYRGEYGLDAAALARWHRPRLEVLAAAGPDVLACETVPCLAEAEARVGEVDRLGLPAWLSLTLVRDASGRLRTRAGEDAAEAFRMAAGVKAVVAVGVNCCEPDDVGPAVELARALTGLPVVAYPNSGEVWDAAARRWTGRGGVSPEDLAQLARTWSAGGARLVGGCCRLGPQHVAALAATAPGLPVGDG
jgi:homocysteine S-methyltransferase